MQDDCIKLKCDALCVYLRSRELLLFDNSDHILVHGVNSLVGVYPHQLLSLLVLVQNRLRGLFVRHQPLFQDLRSIVEPVTALGSLHYSFDHHVNRTVQLHGEFEINN